jgi:hypothetical protein
MRRLAKWSLVTRVAILAGLTVSVPFARSAERTVPSGTNVLHVPMAWCILNGSPAQVAPNITSESGATDTNTDAVIWRRHERPTDNIYMPQATISLRSAINNAWGTFNFPLLNDTDTANGVPGDVNGWNVGTDSTEFTTLVNNCDAAYSAAGRAGIGVTAVNVDLFHDNANSANDGNTQFDYVAIGGWGGCTRVANVCTVPYDGRIMVVDNHFTYPTVADRTFPPSPVDPAGNLQFLLVDPFDQIVGHETGHALGLSHRADTTALMNPSSADNNGDNRTDNIGLNAAEVTSVRSSANNVPGLEVDPEGEFVPGKVLQMQLPDGARERRLRSHLDVAEVRTALDQQRSRLHVAQQLWGLLPCKTLKPTAYDFLVNTDNNPKTGAAPGLIARRGVSVTLQGADLVARVTVVGGKRKGRDFRTCRTKVAAWKAVGKKLTPLPKGSFDAQIQTLQMFPHFVPIPGQKTPRDFIANVYNTIDLIVKNPVLGTARVAPGRAFQVAAGIAVDRKPIDQLGKAGRGGRFILEPPRFPHCFPAGTVQRGGKVDVTFDGLRPSARVHALLGPDLVAFGETDDSGSGSISLPIPSRARLGLHLVTIGHDGLALTADCSVEVVAQG